MKNIFVEINGTMDGKEYFNSIFCPQEKEVLKSVRKHLLDFFGEKEEEVEKDYLMSLSQNIINGGGAEMRITNPNTNVEGSISIIFKGF